MGKICVCQASCHHCGSSVTAELLQACGFSLGSGDIQVRGDKPWNEGGFDNKAAQRINFSILRESQSTPLGYPPIDKSLEDGEKYRTAISEFGKSFDGELFENPATALHISTWDKHCDQITHYLFPYRNPWMTAQSLNRREGIPMRRGYQIWHDYNTRLMSFETKRPVLWVNYEDYRKDLVRELKRIMEFAGKEIDYDKLEKAVGIYRRSKDHGEPPMDEVPPHCHDLFVKMCERASEVKC